MIDLRAIAEGDLVDTLEGEFGLPVVLIAPDGTSCNLRGQIVYDTKTYNPDTGVQMVVPLPVVVLRKSSLPSIPAPGERWIVRIPSTPSATGSLVSYVVERPVEDGRSIGFLNLYLAALEAE